VGTLGDLGRIRYAAPGFVDFDFSLFRTSAPPERYKLHFARKPSRAKSPNYGFKLLASLADKHTPLNVSGQLQPPTLTTSRQIQLGVKFIFDEEAGPMLNDYPVGDCPGSRDFLAALSRPRRREQIKPFPGTSGHGWLPIRIRRLRDRSRSGKQLGCGQRPESQSAPL